MIARTVNRLAAGTKALLVALAVGLILAVGLYASVAAQPADASVKGVCTHGTSIHYGSDGRAHGVVFENDWTRYDGQKMHKVSHYDRVSAPGGAKWFWDWTRSFSRCHTPRA